MIPISSSLYHHWTVAVLAAATILDFMFESQSTSFLCLSPGSLVIPCVSSSNPHQPGSSLICNELDIFSLVGMGPFSIPFDQALYFQWHHVKELIRYIFSEISPLGLFCWWSPVFQFNYIFMGLNELQNLFSDMVQSNNWYSCSVIYRNNFLHHTQAVTGTTKISLLG